MASEKDFKIKLADHDEQILSMVNLMKQLMKPGHARKKPRIGFIPEESG